MNIIIVILICFLSLSSSGYSQTNLLQNPSFENYSDCSSSPLIPYLLNWYIPSNGGSTDYFNTCINPVWPLMGIPNNSFGIQMPHTGFGYCGFGTYEPGIIPYEVKEYLRIKLDYSLDAGKIYCFSFWLSLADSSSFETKTMHVYFSSADEDVLNDENWLVNSQLEFTTGFGLSKNDWTYFEKKFVADGSEQYITIGNFQNNDQIESVFFDTMQIQLYAYYYIDDVELKECGELLVPNVITPNNDGVNDSLLIQNLGNQFIVQVYNRWGALVFETSSPNSESWSGASVSDGVYYLIIISKTNGEVINSSTVHVFH